MRIQGSLPFNVARAYGANPAAGPTATPSANAPAGVPSPAGLTPTIAPTTTGPLTGVGSAGGISQLIAARVPQAIQFDGHPAPTPGPTLQLYTRAADRIEAATGVELGRSIDTKG